MILNNLFDRPNRVTDNKNDEYHLKYARWAVSSALNNHKHQDWIRRSVVNWSFFKNDQWIFEEDLANFLMDEAGNVRNRIKMVKNLIQPMVKHNVGNIGSVSFSARARNISEFALNRRETELQKLLLFNDISGGFPDLAEGIQDQLPIGQNGGETERIFNNGYVDKLSKKVNGLLAYMEELNDTIQAKRDLAHHISITGKSVYKGIPVNGEYVWKVLNSMFHFHDYNAERADLSDSEYQGDFMHMSATTVFEQNQKLSLTNVKLIESAITNQVHRSSFSTFHHHFSGLFTNHLSNQVPVYETYWRDGEYQDFGWVNDQFGYPLFARINNEKASPYTNENLIKKSDLTDAQKEISDGKVAGRIWTEVLRYARFIPSEELEGSNGQDILLDWGKAPYSESPQHSPFDIKFPYKCGTWAYFDGDLMSPVDVAIDPQRLVNRAISASENMMNNSRGSGTIVDKNAVAGQDERDEIERDMNSNRTIYVDGVRLGGIQNTVGKYDNTNINGIVSFFNVAREMQLSFEEITSISQASKGGAAGPDVLVGTLQSQIERGNIVQQDLLFAIEGTFRQYYDAVGNVGRRIYADNPRKLAIQVGDDGVEIITLTKDLRLEEFRMFMIKSFDKATERQVVDSTLLQYRQFQLIDDVLFSNLFGRATMADLGTELRKYQSDLTEAQKQAQEAQAQQIKAAEEKLAQQEQLFEIKEDEAVAREDRRRAEDHMAEIEQIDRRAEGQARNKQIQNQGKQIAVN